MASGTRQQVELSTLMEAILALGKKADAQSQQMNDRLDAQSQQMNDRLDAQSQQMNDRLDAQSQQLTLQAQEMKNQLAAHAQRLEDDLNGKFLSFSVAVREEMGERCKKLSDKLDSKVIDLEGEIGRLLVTTDNRVTELSGQMGEVKNQVDGCVADLSSRVNELANQVGDQNRELNDKFVRLADDVLQLSTRLERTQQGRETPVEMMTFPGAHLGAIAPSPLRHDAEPFRPMFSSGPVEQPATVVPAEPLRRSGSALSVNRDIRPIQRPPLYDGKVAWPAYQAQFEIAAGINGWTESDKAKFLATCLTGPALSVLWNVPAELRGSYRHLCEALNLRFNDSRSGEMAKVRLTGRIRRRGESLPELAADIECLVHQSYPTGDLAMWDTLAADYFINSLDDAEMKRQVKLARPTSLQQALEVAQQVEAVNASVTSLPTPRRAFVRQVDRAWKPNRKRVASESNSDLGSAVRELLQEIRSQKRGPNLRARSASRKGGC